MILCEAREEYENIGQYFKIPIIHFIRFCTHADNIETSLYTQNM